MSETLLNPYFGEFGGMYVPENSHTGTTTARKSLC